MPGAGQRFVMEPGIELRHPPKTQIPNHQVKHLLFAASPAAPVPDEPSLLCQSRTGAVQLRSSAYIPAVCSP